MRIIVGYTAGGGYDAYARLLARHMGRHIPGNPTIIVENMAGAGSVVAANYLYKVAKPDGLTLGTVARESHSLQLAKQEGVEYDWAKFSFMGSMNTETYILQIRADKGMKTLDDIMKAPQKVILGSTGKGTTTYTFPRAIEVALGKEMFKIILGYPGSAENALAVERGEVDGMGGSLSSLLAERPHWLKEKLVNIIVQSGVERHPAIPDVPSVFEVIPTEDGKNVARLAFSGFAWSRPFLAPPGVPKERLDILRKAFANALKDPALLKEAELTKQEISPLLGEQMEKLAQQVMAATPQQLDILKKIYE